MELSDSITAGKNPEIYAPESLWHMGQVLSAHSSQTLGVNMTYSETYTAPITDSSTSETGPPVPSGSKRTFDNTFSQLMDAGPSNSRNARAAPGVSNSGPKRPTEDRTMTGTVNIVILQRQVG
jgi:hypothetical protein